MVNIVEVYSQPKICPAACGHCALKLSGKEPTSNKMDQNVHKTLSLLQELFSKHSMPWSMSYPYPLKSNIEYSLPILVTNSVHNIGLAYGTIDDNTIKNADTVIDDILTKVKFLIGPIKHNANPHFNIAIDFVPQSLYLNDDEISFTKLFVERYKKFIDESSYCNVGIINFLNNRTSAAVLKREKRTMGEKESDLRESYLRDISDEETRIKEHNSRTVSNNAIATFIYDVLAVSPSQELRGPDKKILISKRAISLIDSNYESEEKQLQRAERLYKNRDMDRAVISIHPHGVLLEHSSVDVKNPFLWTTHEKFRQEIKRYLSDTVNSYRNFYPSQIQNLVRRNVGRYQFKNHTFTPEQLKLANGG